MTSHHFPEPSPKLRARARAFVILAAALAFPLALVNALAMAPWLAALALGLAATIPPASALQAFDRRQRLLLVLMLLWAGASLGWSIDRAAGWRSLAMTAGTLLAAAYVLAGLAGLDRDGAGRFRRALAGGAIFAMALVALVAGADRLGLAPGAWRDKLLHLTYHFDRVTTLGALLLWPLAIGLWLEGRRRLGIALVLATAFGCLLSRDLAAKAALFCGLAGLLAGLWRPRAAILLAGLLLIGAWLLMPLAAYHLPPPERSIGWSWLPRSSHHRLTIWRFVGQGIAERPLIGHGLESSRAMPGGKDEILLTDPRDGSSFAEPLLPLHPHNGALQVWLELGAVGALLFALFLASIVRRLWQAGDDRRRLAPALAVFAAGGLVGMVSFGIWQSWWLSSLALAVALPGLAARPAGRDDKPRHLG